MKSSIRRRNPWRWEWFLIAALLLPSALNAQKNDVMGQIQFEGKSSIDKDSGVWVDGQYVGYVKELKGSKKILLLPGEHEIIVRQDGYQDFKRQVQVQPGQTEIMTVSMEKAVMLPLPTVTATVKIVVNPARAAVFVDGLYVGHAGEFRGWVAGCSWRQGHIGSRLPLRATIPSRRASSPMPIRRFRLRLTWSRAAAHWQRLS
jgi:PEGA domain-containing protein